MEFLNVNPYTTSSKSTKVLVLDGTTVKSRVISDVVADGGVASEIGHIMFATAEEGWVMTNVAVSTSPGTPIPVGDARRYVVGYKPTGWRLSFWQYTSGNNSVGLRAEFSTSPTSWGGSVSTDVVYASYDAGADSIRTGTGTISLASSAPFYVRFVMYNNSGTTQSLSVKDVTLELWN